MLTHIHIAPVHGAPVTSLETVEAVAGSGLSGDRNFGRERQVTVVCTGELDQAASALGIGSISPGSTRRNLTVDVPGLPRRPGTRLIIGDVVLEVRRDCAPCETMETSVGTGARLALIDRAGVSARVIRGGTLRVGDQVSIEESRTAAE